MIDLQEQLDAAGQAAAVAMHDLAVVVEKADRAVARW